MYNKNDNQNHNENESFDSCYRYPINIKRKPILISLAYDGTIIIWEQIQKISHYDNKGRILNSIIIPKFSVMKSCLCFQQQINIIFDKQLPYKPSNKYKIEQILWKWNFKQNKTIEIVENNDDQEIRKDQQLFFVFLNSYYCTLVLEFKVELQKKYIRKMKINYFQSSQKLQREQPISSKLINVQTDQIFQTLSFDELKFDQTPIQSQKPCIIICNRKIKCNEEFQFKIFLLQQNKQFSFQTYKIPLLSLQLVDDFEGYFYGCQQEKEKLYLMFNFKQIQLQYVWQINNNNQLVYQTHNLKPMYKNNLKKLASQSQSLKNQNKEYFLKFKDYSQNSLKIKILDDCPVNNTIYNQNTYFERNCYTPQYFNKISAKAFTRHDEIIIVIKNKQLQEKIQSTFLLGSIFEDWSQDLIEKVIGLLFEYQRNWRE